MGVEARTDPPKTDSIKHITTEYTAIFVQSLNPTELSCYVITTRCVYLNTHLFSVLSNPGLLNTLCILIANNGKCISCDMKGRDRVWSI